MRKNSLVSSKSGGKKSNGRSKSKVNSNDDSDSFGSESDS